MVTALPMSLQKTHKQLVADAEAWLKQNDIERAHVLTLLNGSAPSGQVPRPEGGHFYGPDKDRGTGTRGGTSRRRRRGMSAAGRKAVSERMKKYWAARRKAKK